MLAISGKVILLHSDFFFKQGLGGQQWPQLCEGRVCKGADHRGGGGADLFSCEGCHRHWQHTTATNHTTAKHFFFFIVELLHHSEPVKINLCKIKFKAVL